MAQAKTSAQKPWEQLEGEANEAYARFLIYRNLGPARTVLLAYAAHKSMAHRTKDKPIVRAPLRWLQNYRDFQWKDRAAAWDIAQMANAVPEAATTIFKLMSESARACLGEVANGNIKPQNFDDLKDMVVILGGFISPQVIRTTIDNAGNTGESEPRARG